MIAWSFVIIFFLVTGTLLVRTMMDRSHESKKHHVIQAPPSKPQPPQDLVHPEMKEQITEMEKRVFGKADEVKRIADEETEIIALDGSGLPIPPEKFDANETAQFLTIKKKVDEVQKLSGGMS